MRYRVKKSIHFERVTGGGPLGLDTSVSKLMPISITGVPSTASNSLHHWFKSNPASKRECKAQTARSDNPKASFLARVLCENASQNNRNVLWFSRQAYLWAAGDIGPCRKG